MISANALFLDQPCDVIVSRKNLGRSRFWEFPLRLEVVLFLLYSNGAYVLLYNVLGRRLDLVFSRIDVESTRTF